MFTRGFSHVFSAWLVAALAVTATSCNFEPRTNTKDLTAAVVTAPPQLELSVVTGVTGQAQVLYAPTHTVGIQLAANRDIQYWCLSEIQTTAPGALKGGCEGGTGEADGWTAMKPTQYVFTGGDGPHKLYAWAYGANQRFSEGPATAEVTIDTTAPTFSMTAPTAFVRSGTISIPWSATDAGSGVLSCTFQVDGGTAMPCPQPLTITGLSNGSHTITGTVTDKVGNSTLFRTTTLVDTVPPTIAFTSTPSAMSNQTTAIFSFSVTDAGSGPGSASCSIDGGLFSACASPATFSGLAEGGHLLTVHAADLAGNQTNANFSWTVDLRPPAVSISQTPALNTPLLTARFVFAAADATSGVAGMSCQLDSAGFSPCTSPVDYAGLALGTHRFDVRATDNAGNTSIPVSFTWVIDTGAPAITVRQQPSTPTKQASATFAWTSSSPSGVASESCQIDGGTAATCFSPVTLTSFTDGAHTFTIRATNMGGTTGAQPVTWVVDTVPPVVTITNKPLDLSNQSTAIFQFSATDATTSVALVECQLDGGGYSSCSSPITFSGLKTGTHLFELRATDLAGNTSLPISDVWQIDLIPPTVTITSQPPAIGRATSATITWTASDNVAIAKQECDLDGTGFATCASPKSLTNLSAAAHIFTVRATDSAGNSTSVPVNWVVDPNYISPELRLAATNIGKQYDCPLASSVGYDAGNVGVDYIADQQAYAAAKLMVDKKCVDSNTPKSVTFAVSTLNFPSDGTATGAAAGLKGSWLQYWDDLANRWSALGFKISIEPYPFIINDNAEGTTQPGLRWLRSSELNLAAAAVPEVYSCRDGRKTVLASVYDARTLDMAKSFYMGIKSVFSKYAAFDNVAIVPPSDYGAYGFPQGVSSGWTKSSDDVSNCFKTGDTFAKAMIAADPPAQAKYNGVLNLFRSDLYAFVAAQFTGKNLVMYAGYADDDPTGPGGFQYSELTAFAASKSVALHSTHGLGSNAAVPPLDKLTLSSGGVPALPATTSLSLEDSGLAFEFEEMRNMTFIEHYRATSHTFLADPLLNAPYLMALSNGLGAPPPGSLYPDKGATWAQFGGLGTFHNSHLSQSAINAPAQNSTLQADSAGLLDAWGYFDTYGDMRNEKVLIYAGPLSTDSKFNTGGTSPSSNAGAERTTKGRDPQFMRLVGSTTTSSSRTVTGNDTSRFSFNWKPDLANGSAIVRFFLANSNAGIVAELPNSPVLVTISGKTTGNYTITRTGFDGTHLCSNTFTVSGNAKVSTLGAVPLDIVILDEYRGTVLAQGSTDTAGNFSIPIAVAKQPGGAYPAFRAYVYFDNNGDSVKDLVALPMDLSQASLGLGYNRIGSVFWTVADCP